MVIITQKSYTSATKSTISRWIKLALNSAGIDIKTRSASASAVLRKIPIDTNNPLNSWVVERFCMSNSSEFSHAVLNA